MVHIKVPSRICFFGDHQDYLGLPVIAAAIDRFISLRARPIAQKKFQVDLKDLGTSLEIDLDEGLDKLKKGDYFRSGMAVLKQRGFSFQEGFQIEVSGNIPINAGLSSSSALVVAWIRFLVATQKGVNVPDAEIGHWAYEAEVRYFDQPGGLMDQYTIAQKGLLFIDTISGSTRSLIGNLGTLVVAESGLAKKTLEVLKNARLFQESAIAEVKSANPDFDIQKSTLNDYETYLDVVSAEYRKHWFAAIHNFDITKRAKALLLGKRDNLEALGDLMNRHQTILENHIGNTPTAMVKMMEAALGAGALGAKIIGSGGGGCMVAMVGEINKKNVINAFLKAGAKAAYEVKLVNAIDEE